MGDGKKRVPDYQNASIRPLGHVYSAGFQFAALAGSAVEIEGAADKVIYVTRIHIHTSAPCLLTIVKRSALSTGGTDNDETLVPHDSLAPAADVTVTSFTAAPTQGTEVGVLGMYELSALETLLLDFNEIGGGPVVLRSATQAVGIETDAAATLTCRIEVVEE